MTNTLHPSTSTPAHEAEARMISYSTLGLPLIPHFVSSGKSTWLVYYVLKQVFVVEACTLIHLLLNSIYFFTGIFLLAFVLPAVAIMLYLQDTLSFSS